MDTERIFVEQTADPRYFRVLALNKPARGPIRQQQISLTLRQLMMLKSELEKILNKREGTAE